MSKCLMMAGKNGDVINILPVLRAEFLKTGKPANLVIAKEYAPLVSGLEYVKPCIFNGHWTDFKKAFTFAKQMFDNVVVPQVHGEGMTFQHLTPSVMLDSWARAGYLDKWDTLPLVIPRPKVEKSEVRTIFYADHSQSSPFFHKEDLHKLLIETFPTHQIVRASGMRFKSLMEFLPLMDRADLIVSVETAFLHLSAACVTPTVAFVTNLPTHWHGSPWSRRFAFHCRYNEFESRKVELVCAMKRAVNKAESPQPEIISTAQAHGYNMTMLSGGRFVYRYHPVSGYWKTRLAISLGNNEGFTQDIKFPIECDNYSMEDARSFTLNGVEHLAYTCSREAGGRWYSIQAYGPLENIDGQWRVTKHIVPKCAGNDFNSMQKNYTPFVHDGKLHLIYGNLAKTQEQLILQMDGDKVVKEHRSKAPEWAWGGIRGGCVVPYKGQILRFFHSRTGDTHKHYGFRYHLAASLLEPEPPFKTTLVSSFPILSGNEKYTPNCLHWKPGCALVYGAVLDGEGFVISGGLNDCEAFTMKLKFADLNL